MEKVEKKSVTTVKKQARPSVESAVARNCAAAFALRQQLV